jgi:iron complex outermembrane receptor protein
MQDVYFRPNPKLFGQMHIWLQQSERSLPQLETNESLQDQSQNTQTDNTMRLATQWKYYNGPHRFHTKLSIAFNQLDYQLKIQNGGFDNIHTQIDSHSKVITTNAELGYNRAWGEKIQLDINANTKADKVNSLESVTQSGYHKTRQQHALYAGLSLQASKSIVTKISLRQEIYDTRISKPVGNVGIQWQPLATHNWILKVSAAYNEHKPSLNDLYFQPGGNPNLKTETSTNIEFGTSYQYENSLLGYSTDLSIYHAPVRNWILWLPNPRGFWEPTNVDKVRTYGLEYNLQAHYNINHWKFSTKANFGLNYSLNYGAPNHWADASLGKQLPYIPRRSANATATIGYKQWDLNYNFSHYSKRYTTTSNETETSLDYLYPYYMSDLSLSYQTAIRKSKLQLELKIYNLLNEEYHTILQRPMPGINAQFTIALSY